MRRFIRHPADIPIELEHDRFRKPSVQNVSYGGLALLSDAKIAVGAIVGLRIPHLRPPFEVSAARVVWCEEQEGGFAMGVQFLDAAEAFHVRMVEQICHIESYRRKVAEQEGRRLTAEEAAIEWVGRHASSFPNP